MDHQALNGSSVEATRLSAEGGLRVTDWMAIYMAVFILVVLLVTYIISWAWASIKASDGEDLDFYDLLNHCHMAALARAKGAKGEKGEKGGKGHEAPYVVTVEEGGANEGTGEKTEKKVYAPTESSGYPDTGDSCTGKVLELTI